MANVYNAGWRDDVLREGTISSNQGAAPDEDGEPPCPGCGTALPLVDGACSDCGLQLE